jgi:competence protein ComEC
LYFLDVGYGDSLLIRFPNGKAALVDGGGPEAGPEICAAIERLGLNRLDYLIITHFHKDHAGGLLPVLKNWISGGNGGEILLTHLPEAVPPEVEPVIAEIQNRSHRTIRRGIRLEPSPGVGIEILHPANLSGEVNDDSLVIGIRHSAVRILLCGDIQLDGQRELMGHYKGGLRSDLVKIPHHAAEGLEEFVQSVNPKEAVLSIGPNRRGAPNSEVLAFYEKIGCRIHRTDKSGTIEMVSDSRTVRRADGKAGAFGEVRRSIK